MLGDAAFDTSSRQSGCHLHVIHGESHLAARICHMTVCASKVQELICEGALLHNVLRLMVLVTLTAGGIPKKYYDPLRREVLHTYGHENIVTLSWLQEAGGASLIIDASGQSEPYPSTQGHVCGSAVDDLVYMCSIRSIVVTMCQH